MWHNKGKAQRRNPHAYRYTGGICAKEVAMFTARKELNDLLPAPIAGARLPSSACRWCWTV